MKKKVVRLNENDIEILVKKIIREDDEILATDDEDYPVVTFNTMISKLSKAITNQDWSLVGDVMADLQSYDVKLANKSSMSDTDRLNWFGGR